MWRLFQKGIKCGKSVKATCIVVCPEDAQPHRPTKKLSNEWVIQCSHFHSSYEDSGGGGPEHRGGGSGPDHEWKWRMNAFQFDMCSRHSYCHILEAMGWGSAVITGFQVTDLCRQSGHMPDENKCWVKKMISSLPNFGWSHVNDLLSTYSSYTVSVLSQALSGTLLSANRILPAKRSSSTNLSSVSAAHQSAYNVEDNDKATVDEFDEVPVDQAEDFIDGCLFGGSISSDNVQQLNDSSSPSSVATDSIWLELIKQHVAAVHQNANALKSVQKGDLSTAVRIWSVACNSPVHSPLSLFNLAVCYEQGLGVEQNLDKAAELYLKASDLGHAKSAYNLAMLIMRKSDSIESIEQGMDLLEKASDLGLKEAHRELGVLYTEPPKQDMVRAAELFEKASAQQDARATYFLGICYERGLGVIQNEAKAASLYKLSGELGCGDAMYNLAVFFEHGMGGLPSDKYEAIRYYQAALNAGISQATEKLNILNKEHPLLTAIITDSRDVKSRDHSSRLPFNQIFGFSLSTDSESDEQSEVSLPMMSDSCSSDTSTGCSESKSLWQLRTSQKPEGMFYLHSSSSGSSSSDEETSQHHNVDHFMHLRHREVADSTTSSQSVDTTNLLHFGSFGMVSLNQVSSFG